MYKGALQNEGRELRALARAGELPATLYRERDVDQLRAQLERGRAVVLVGPEGVGKTGVMHALASMADSPKVYSLSTTQLLVGTKYLGEWQSKVIGMVAELQEEKAFLYIPDLWNLTYAGRSAGDENNVLDAWRPFLMNHELPIIGEASPAILRMMARIPGFLNLLVTQNVVPLSSDQVEGVLLHTANEGKYQLDKPCIQSLLRLTDRFSPSQCQPRPALDLLEQVRHYQREKSGIGEAEELSPALIERVFSIYTGLPLFVVSQEETKPVREIREWFQERIIGQQSAIEAICETIALFKAGLHDQEKPIGTFLFVGPTGVGKTEIARALSTFLFRSRHRLLRFDMSEFKSFHSYETLVGDPKEPGREATLVDPVRQQPFQVILLDELEKAHQNVWDLMLQILDEGRLTTPSGQTVNFQNTLVIATSNVGAQDSGSHVGFGKATDSSRAMDVRKALEEHFRPEFLNRFQHVVIFHALSREQVRQIARQELKRILGREGITRRNLVIDVDDSALELVIERGYDPRYGARALKREIQRRMVLPIAVFLMERHVEPGSILKISDKDGHIRVRKIDTEESRKSRQSAAPMKTATGEKLLPEQLLERLQAGKAAIEAIRTAIDAEQLVRERNRLLDLRQEPGFWQDQGQAAIDLRDLDRVTVTLDRLDGISAWSDQMLERVAEKSRSTNKRLAGELARFERNINRLHRELVRIGHEGAWDAIVEINPVGPTATFARSMLCKAYIDWAEGTGRSAELICHPLAADEPVLLLITGRFASGMLALEAGLHRVRKGKNFQVVRVRVAPWTDEKGEVAFQSHRALKTTAGSVRIRSRLVTKSGLVLQNSRTLAENRELAGDLEPSWSSSAPPSDEVVRRYELEPPKLRDALTGFSSGKRDAMSAKALHALLCLRVDNQGSERP